MSRQKLLNLAQFRSPVISSLSFLTLLLVSLGVIAVYNASVVDAYTLFNNKYYFALQQLKWAVLGITAMLIISRFPPVLFKRLAPSFLIISLVLMLAVLIPGIGNKVLGARRWINLLGFTLQPSEFTKLALMLYLSSWLEKDQPLISFTAIITPILALIMLQPDLGTAIIIASSSILLYFISGADISKLLTLIFGGGAIGLLLILSSAYRRARLLTFLNPTSDPLGSSYHINQILIALGSGGLIGVGLGRSRQKYQYLPEATTDSIFAIIGEEMGFIGGLVIIFLLLALVYVGFRIARQSQVRFNQLLAASISGLFATQVLLNLAAMVAIVPLTGIPLPLISYGGSSLITLLSGIGILLSIARYERL